MEKTNKQTKEKSHEDKNAHKQESAKIVVTHKNSEKEKNLSIRGRIFEGYVTKKFPKRVVIEFERPVYVRKFERYLKLKTKLHARLPNEMEGEIMIGDFIQIRECRPLSKIIHFIVIKKIRSRAIQKGEAENFKAVNKGYKKQAQ